MITHVNPYDASVAHTSRNDAVNAILDTIREAGGDLNDYNIEGIADEVIFSQGEGHMIRYFIAADDEEFWDSVLRNHI